MMFVDLQKQLLLFTGVYNRNTKPNIKHQPRIAVIRCHARQGLRCGTELHFASITSQLAIMQ